MTDVDNVDVVLANNDRMTLRVGDAFLKIDADQIRTDIEVEAIKLAPVPKIVYFPFGQRDSLSRRWEL
jgi:hypothetical protein